MCEVGSCCGCICLYKGSLIIGLITILAASAQLSIFSLILVTTFESLNTLSSQNASAEEDSSAFYSFTSTSVYCPFGFIPLSVRDGPPDDPPTEEPESVEFDLTTITDLDFNYSTIFNSSFLVTRTNSCLAPPQGVLWALVVASALYIPIGIVLMIGVKKGISCLLSTWFFYTVGYNLLALIIALTDGVYASAGDVSSYVVVMVTAYCIIIVDSYYEKLLRTEKGEDCSKDQSRPSLVLDKSSPVSLNSSECPTTYATPMGKLSTPPPGYAPCAAGELLLPSTSPRPSSPTLC